MYDLIRGLKNWLKKSGKPTGSAAAILSGVVSLGLVVSLGGSLWAAFLVSILITGVFLIVVVNAKLNRLHGRMEDMMLEVRLMTNRAEQRALASATMDSSLLQETDGNARILQVVGVPRSGTTILAVVLNADPNVVCLIEPFLSWFQKGRFFCREEEGVEGERAAPPHRVIGELRHKTGLRWVGFKETFRLSGHVAFSTDEFLRRNQDDGAVDATIAIVRDPRDVWVSTLTRFEDSSETALGTDFTDTWNEFVYWVLDRELFYLRYENLVTDPLPTINRLADYLELEFREVLLDPPEIRGAGDARAERGGPLFASSVGRYRSELSDDARRFIEVHCERGIKLLGYSFGETIE